MTPWQPTATLPPSCYTFSLFLLIGSDGGGAKDASNYLPNTDRFTNRVNNALYDETFFLPGIEFLLYLQFIQLILRLKRIHVNHVPLFVPDVCQVIIPFKAS